MSLTATELTSWCDSLVSEGLATAVACRIRGRGLEPLEAAAGAGELGGALFDLASLTKPVSATLALTLDRSRRLPLATRLGDVWKGTSDTAAAWRLGDLLRHRSRLRRWMPLYASCRDEREVVERLLGEEWLREDAAPAYSDLDYILWGLTVEKALGSSYWELLERHVLPSLGRDRFAACGRDGGGERAGVALECSLTTAREVELARARGLDIDELPAPGRGEAQDGNCRFFGRPVGHAGLFASLSGVWRLAEEWRRPGALLSREAVGEALGGSDRFALGWFRRGETAASRQLGPDAFGHDGFTGGTVWIDPRAEVTCVVLCHRATLAADLSGRREELLGRLMRT